MRRGMSLLKIKNVPGTERALVKGRPLFSGSIRKVLLKEYEWQLDIGASVVNRGVRFRVWVPEARKVSVKLLTEAGPREIDLSREEWGYHGGLAEGVCEQDRYSYVLDGITERPDPASRFQPQGVHGPSQVVDRSSGGTTGVGPGSPGTIHTLRVAHRDLHRQGTFEAAIALSTN